PRAPPAVSAAACPQATPPGSASGHARMCSGSRRSRSSDREHAKGSRPDQGSRRIHARWTAGPEVREWYSHQESNLDQRFRKPPLYPFELWEHVGWAPAATARGPALCFDEATRQAASPPRPGRPVASKVLTLGRVGLGGVE